jgi:glycine oxidase
MAKIDILGAGIVGVWQAFMLQRRGHQVSVWDPGGIPSSQSASRLAGAMLAPYCEGEPGHELARDLGIESLGLWRRLYPQTVMRGSLLVAAARDQAELIRFARVTEGHRWLDAHEATRLEPALEGRFHTALFFENEGHVEPWIALNALAEQARERGASFRSEFYDGAQSGADWVIDCRGFAAKDQLKSLRGIRGERLIIECRDIELERPVRLLHPRIPFYIVPWSEGRFMIGATVIESEDRGAPMLRSALEIMGAAYALLPALGEARIIEAASGVRPAFPDNTPKIIARGRTLFVNGMYRHGFLLSPIFAELTADYIERGTKRDGVIFEDHGEW